MTTENGVVEVKVQQAERRNSRKGARECALSTQEPP